MPENCPKCGFYLGVEPNVELECDTLYQLVTNVIRHVRMTGSKIVSSDDPMRLRIGFETLLLTGPHAARWSIGIAKVREVNLAAAESAQLAAYIPLLATAQGRQQIADLWSLGQEPFLVRE
jgi:hypothetical protein